jgi:hypothetical protein
MITNNVFSSYGMVDYRRGSLCTYFSNREREGCAWGGVMSARQLIDNASFGPVALKAIGEAFDAAWTEIAGGFVSDPIVIEAARLKLANAILSLAKQDSRDVEALKRAALEVMARSSQP